MSETTNVYLAGSLFDARQLAGNLMLAHAIEEAGNGRYAVLLPQDIELPAMDPKSIRDADFRALLTSDAAIFLFEGSDLDSGMVAELMAAKFADIPSVLLRTDFRRAGDRNANPWNLMCDGFPRTETLVIDAMALYAKSCDAKSSSEQTAEKSLMNHVAIEVIEKLDTVMRKPPVVDDRSEALAWLEKTLDLKIHE